MKEICYQVIAENISDSSQAPKGEHIFYKCTKCGGIISSQPADSVGCSCDNVFIDTDYFRLDVKDFTKFQAVKWIRKE